ncbi:type IV pilus assembly protein PilM [Patescibacteria group bacterium]|nr:type IV pilus assembly protein PilM [Patescibacteria group bacterium]
MLKYIPFKNPIGLDISDYKIRFFQIKNKRGTKVKVQSFGEIDVPENYIQMGEIINEKGAINLLKTMLSNPAFGKTDSNYVQSSLPDKKTFIKTIAIPKVPENELQGAIQWGIEQNIPITLDQVYFDWHILPQKNNEKIWVTVSVAPKEIVESYGRILKEVNLIPISFENESVAIARCLINQQNNMKQSCLIIDLGKSRTNVIVYAGGTIQYNSTIDIGGQEMTKIIAKSIKLDIKDAEKAKVICGLNDNKARGQIKKILEPAINRLINKAIENIEYYENYMDSNNSKIDKVIITGSVSRMDGLPRYLEKKLKRTVSVGNPWTNCTATNYKNWKTDFLPYSTVIGLSLKDSNII